MNLYIFNKSGKAAVFGIGTYIRELKETLGHSDINVCIVNLYSQESQIKFEQINSIRYWYFPAPILEQRSIDNQRQMELYYRNIVFLLQLHIDDKIDLIFHLNYMDSKPLADALKTVFNCKIVTVVHYLDWCFSLSGNVSRFSEILTSEEIDSNDEFKKSIFESCRKEKDFFEIVDHIICLSENTRQILQNDYKIMPNKTNVIYNGLTDNHFVSDKLMLQRKYHIPNIPIILFVGRLDDIKGLKYALQSFKIVLKTQYCHFIIAGNGEFDIYMKECEDIWTHITWTGLISKEKLYDLYSIADIGIMTSFHEQCSYVAIEMMMHGVPLIASTSTGLKEMVEDGVTGLHIPVIEHPDKVEIDTDLLAEKMLYLLQHPDERKRMGVNARKRYETVYSSEIFRQNMLHFYESLFVE